MKIRTKGGEDPDAKKSPGRKGGGLGPGKRWGHTCNTLRNGRSFYVFGGYGKDNSQTNDVHIFDTNKQTWTKPILKGNSPTPRDSHSCTTVGSCLFVFGGTDGQNPLRDLVILDTATNSWMEPEVQGEGPTAREGHSGALIGHRLFIFGGCGKTQEEDEIYYNDLYILDTTNLTWTRAVTSGKPPSPRDSHTCSSWNNKIIVVGGEDALGSYLSDVHVLDADTLVWEQLKTTGQILTPRAGHSTVSLGNFLFVFGGFTDDRCLFDDLHMLNIETGAWTEAVTDGMGPSSRFSVAGDCLDYKRGVLVFIGGCNEKLEALDELYYLHTEMSLENEQEEQKPEKLSLRKELKRKRQEHTVLSNNTVREGDMPNFDGINTPALPTVPPENTSADKCSLYDFKPVEEKIFEAKITDVFHYGYTIESNIEGKHLRGLLFSYKPGFAHAVHSYLSRKNLASESNAGKLKEAKRSKLKIARATKQSIKKGGAQQPEVVANPEANEQGVIVELPASSSNKILIFGEQYQHNMQAAPSQSISVHFNSKPDIGLGFERTSHFTEGKAPSLTAIGLGFESTSHFTEGNAPALTATQEGACAIQIAASPANQVGSQSIQEDVNQIERMEQNLLG